MNRIIACTLLLFILVACTKESKDTFSDYISAIDISAEDNLVACAASYLIVNINTEYRTSIYFRSISDQKNLKLWHSESFSQDLNLYEEVEISSEDILNGFMGIFISELTTGAFIVSAENEAGLAYSKPIEVLTNEQNTIIDVDIDIDLTNTLEPLFTWPQSTTDTSSIYFHLIVDQDKNEAISGTYSYENSFQFYDLSNVVFNVTESMNPVLENNTEYMIQIMDVSDNNWVTKIRRQIFNTN